MAVISAPATLNLVGTVGVPVSYNTPNATYTPGGVYTTEYVFQSGTLVPGVSTFNPAENTPFSSVPPILNSFLSGTPTMGGLYSFILRWFESGDESNFSDQTININICDIQLTPSSIQSGRIGTPYSQIITASNGTAPYTISISSGSLPNGLSGNQISATEFQISGIPQAIGSYVFEITATDDASCSVTMEYTININRKLRKKKIRGAIVGQNNICLQRFDKYGNEIICNEIINIGKDAYKKIFTQGDQCCYKRIS